MVMVCGSRYCCLALTFSAAAQVNNKNQGFFSPIIASNLRAFRFLNIQAIYDLCFHPSQWVFSNAGRMVTPSRWDCVDDDDVDDAQRHLIN